MESAIWLVIIGLVFCGLVWGGFWVIGKAGLGRIAQVAFGIIVLIIVVFALVYLTRGGGWHGSARVL